MSDFLEEIWYEILLRLPIKTLVICACTSKTLHTLITSPNFMTTHLSKSKDKPFIFLKYHAELKNKRVKEYFGLHLDDESFEGEFHVMEVPMRPDVAPCFKVVGCCNGVVCLADDLKDVIYLWNPCIRKSIRLPSPSVTDLTHGDHRMCLGFGFDQSVNDFKVVRLAYLGAGGVEVEVYTVGSGLWRSIKVVGPVYETGEIKYWSYSQCFLNGVLHWPGCRDGVWCAVMTFNVQDECFGEMKLPAFPEGPKKVSYHEELKITTCLDMLGLIQMQSDRPMCCSVNTCCIWVMKEYGVVDSWTKMFCFTDLCFRPTAFGFRKNEDILVLFSDRFFGENAHMFAFNLSKGCKKKIKMFDASWKGFCYGSYEASLALFVEGKLTLEDDKNSDEEGEDGGSKDDYENHDEDVEDDQSRDDIIDDNQGNDVVVGNNQAEENSTCRTQ